MALLLLVTEGLQRRQTDAEAQQSAVVVQTEVALPECSPGAGGIRVSLQRQRKVKSLDVQMAWTEDACVPSDLQRSEDIFWLLARRRIDGLGA